MYDYDTCSESVLVKRARKKDVKAFSKLYENVYKDLYYFALYMMKNPQDAEDVVSETVLSVYENIYSLQKDEAFRGWIFKILSNVCKQIIALSVFGGYNSKEIGKILAEQGKPMNANTVRSKRSRALEKLGKILC